jgi:hypothetical protein
MFARRHGFLRKRGKLTGIRGRIRATEQDYRDARCGARGYDGHRTGGMNGRDRIGRDCGRPFNRLCLFNHIKSGKRAELLHDYLVTYRIENGCQGRHLCDVCADRPSFFSTQALSLPDSSLYQMMSFFTIVGEST